jgi:tetratricopeptide (TPR) repeat protein
MEVAAPQLVAKRDSMPPLEFLYNAIFSTKTPKGFSLFLCVPFGQQLYKHLVLIVLFSRFTNSRLLGFKIICKLKRPAMTGYYSFSPNTANTMSNILRFFFPFLLSLAFLLVSTLAGAQSPAEQARALGRQAIQRMDAGDIAASLELLAKAQLLDPNNIDYPYEVAYAHYLNKDYPNALKVLRKLAKHPNANDRVHQMLGNAYDMNKQSKKAIAAYEEGLRLFPKSGILHLERGNMELKEERYLEALEYYERGIAVQPTFPSNYFWASKIYLSSDEKIWGFLYGELFMNLERNSPRTAEMSKHLYDSYTSNLVIEAGKTKNKKSISFNICKNTIYVDPKQGIDENTFKLPFCLVYGTVFSASAALVEEVDLHSLCHIRNNFTELYYQQEQDEEYDNLLFQYQQRLLKNGHLDAYNHWLLMKGDEPAFGAWLKEHQEEWEAFVDWFSEHPLLVDPDNYFHSSQL